MTEPYTGPDQNDVDDVSTVDDFGPDPDEQAARDQIAALAAAINDAIGVEAVPEPPQPSARQRLRIHVPNVSTTLALGAKAPDGKIRDADEGTPNYDGFGVGTAGHIWMDAEKTMTFQSTEHGAVQAMGNLALGSGSDLVIGSKGSGLLSSGSGVTIVGGFPSFFPENPKNDGSDPQTPPWVAPISAAASAMSTLAGGVDAGIGLSEAVARALKTRQGEPFKKWELAGWLGGLVDGVAGAIGTLSSAAGVFGGQIPYVTPASNFLAGTTVYGAGGVLIASPIATDMYSLMGTTIFSAANVGVRGLYVELKAVMDMAISAAKGEFSINSAKVLSLKSDEEVAIGAKGGPISLLGDAITIGASSGAGGQAATASIKLDATSVEIGAAQQDGKTVTIKAGAFNVFADIPTIEGAYTAVVKANGPVHLESKEHHATVSGKLQAAMVCGETRIVMDGSKLFLGHGPGTPPEPPAPPELTPEPAGPNARAGVSAKSRSARRRARENQAKVEAHAKAMKAHAEKCKNLKETKSGIIIDSSTVAISVSGHKLTFDGSKMKHPSMTWQK